MARSRRRTPIHSWTTAHSEKEDKQIWHRRFRRRTKEAIHRGDELMPHFREVSNPWSMAKDGKGYWARPRQARIWYWWRPVPLIETLEDRLAWWNKWMRK